MTDAQELLAEIERAGVRLAAEGGNVVCAAGEDKLTDSMRQRIKEQKAALLVVLAPTVEILDSAPSAIHRPLCLVDSMAYAATWLWLRQTIEETVDKAGKRTKHAPPLIEEREAVVIVRGDGRVFSDDGIPGANPLADLGLTVRLHEPLPKDRAWSGAGVKRFMAGERPDVGDVFRRIKQVVNRFLDFSRSFGNQAAMCELVACYVLATYLLDAFSVIGYLWPNGDRGAGKTTLLQVVSELAYLGLVILAGGSFASLRDLADYGATLCFDDADGMLDPKRSDPDKRTLLLAGNRRGATVPLKEPAGPRGWVTRHVDAFCPRLFSAIRLPDEVLASRTITVPLVRSTDPERAKASPLDPAAWPTDRRRLVDDLWALALVELPSVKTYDQAAAGRAQLSGRDLEPWRAILAVALWLQERHGVSELFDRLEALSVSYQTERSDLEASDPTRLCIMALTKMIADAAEDSITFETSTLAARINALAIEAEVATPGEDWTNAKRVGRLLKRLRLTKAESGKTRRRWKITADEVEALARSYGMSIGVSIPLGRNAENAGNAETPTPTDDLDEDPDSAFLQVRRFRHFPGEVSNADQNADAQEVLQF